MHLSDIFSINKALKTSVAIGLGLSLVACNSDSNKPPTPTPTPIPTPAPTPAPSDDDIVFDANQFSKPGDISNQYFPLTPGEFRSYTKMEDGEVIGVIEQRVLAPDPDSTIAIAGISEYVIVEEVEFIEGEVTETNRDYYAQDDNGHVWQLGSDVLSYDDGYEPEGGNNEDSWHAGTDDAVAGLVMSFTPAIGDSYAVPGEPEVTATVIDVNQMVTSPYDGATNRFDPEVETVFTNVITIEHSEGATVEDTLHYASSVGFVSGSESADGEGNQETSDLFGFATAEYDDGFDVQNFSNPNPSKLQDLNPYLPLFPGNKWVYLKNLEDGIERITTEVSTTKTRVIMGVNCIVIDDIVEVKLEGSDVFVPEEVTEDYYAMDDEGNIWYMGEESSHFNPETGEFERDGGSWIAGETIDESGNLAQPGILIHAQPEPGMVYRQEFLAGVAEDMATVVGKDIDLEIDMTVDGIQYSDIYNGLLKTHEFAAHELSVTEPLVTEFKYYMEGIGKVVEENPNDEEIGFLVEFINASVF